MKRRFKANPKEKKYLTHRLRAIEVGKKKTVSQLLHEMTATGFQGRKLGEAVEVWEKMIKDPNVTIVMGYAASLSTTGQWKIINWLIENRFIDILVSTGANISEDIVDAMGFPYYRGSHIANDVDLLEASVNRYYDVYGSDTEYMEMIELIAEFMMTLDLGYNYSSRELLYQFGLWLQKKKIKSIVAEAAVHGVPIFSPAVVDSAYGDAGLIARQNDHPVIIDQAKDFYEFMSTGQHSKDIGVIYIGGGVPKDFIQLLAVSSPLLYKNRKTPNKPGGMYRPETKEYYYPHKYALQITTDAPQWGGLSGCTFEEASSWGKEYAGGDNVAAYLDATVALPLVTQALKERKLKRRTPANFSWLFRS